MQPADKRRLISELIHSVNINTEDVKITCCLMMLSAAVAEARVTRFSANIGDCGTVSGAAFAGCTPCTGHTVQRHISFSGHAQHAQCSKHITWRTVAQHCCNDNQQIQWENGTSTSLFSHFQAHAEYLKEKIRLDNLSEPGNKLKWLGNRPIPLTPRREAPSPRFFFKPANTTLS